MLGALSPEIKEEVKRTFIIPNSQKMKNLRIEGNLTNLYYYFNILEIVFGEEKESFREFEDALKDRIIESFLMHFEERSHVESNGF